MIEFTFRATFGQVFPLLAWLLVFGVVYNSLVAWLECKGYTEGFLSLIVALGVFGTLMGIASLSWQVALVALAGFVATGTPMIVGSIARYIRQREALKRELMNGFDTLRRN